MQASVDVHGVFGIQVGQSELLCSTKQWYRPGCGLENDETLQACVLWSHKSCPSMIDGSIRFLVTVPCGPCRMRLLRLGFVVFGS